MPALPLPQPFPRKSITYNDLGKISNSLGILTDSCTHFYPKVLLEIFPNATELADILGLQRTQLYKEHIALKKGTSLRKRIIQLVTATDLAFALFGHDKTKTIKWLMAPNFNLFGDSPFEVIMRDEADALISWLLERSGLKPGSAF